MTRNLEPDVFQWTLAWLSAPAHDEGERTQKVRAVRKKKFRLTKRLLSDNNALPDEALPPEALRAHVTILDQPSSKTLSVCWSDPTSGYYGDQIWRIGLARQASFCVLSGRPIRYGDAVFRPRSCDIHCPANRDRMILAAAVPAWSPEREHESEEEEAGALA
ncbi:DUF3331 domain-containing protein [Paraburkholderia saeva]|jgi:Domain of unknown function (DUF3331)|uniref:DUF3331 domain-containing protein n=1 Tax=Paraburkholderia saeva TaxID=2777537 RepID=A0A9N8RY07_9BURK|nr:DUF3331 domain-containing protein [Paraburkholderia saeva]CAG4901204.1 hypothetical protein LMG31841_02965 [Paraburkholderia saeva]